MHGWIILDKPLGLGSTQGVSAVKRALRDGGYAPTKKDMPKVGHGGTLDPLATGVLPIAVGEATKLAGRMLDASKIYDFTISFGTETDTLDAEGQVIATSEVQPSLAAIEAVLPRFTGLIDQVPPTFSALKVDGKRAYDLARAGEAVELKSRQVEIFQLKPYPPVLIEGISEITLTAHVSKGTYIRSLARDIAHALGTVGHVTMLRRTKAGPFTLVHAISLDKLADAANRQRLEDVTLPIRTALDDIPALALDPDQARLLKFGQVISGVALADGLYFAQLEETPIALVQILDGNIRVDRGFNP
jgi:tRNA pseudouridine55 synthase